MVRGTTSLAALRTIAEDLGAWLPNAEHLVLECSHVTYAEQPDEFAGTVASVAFSSQTTRPHVDVRRRCRAVTSALTEPDTADIFRIS
jgi:hypothetical protein